MTNKKKTGFTLIELVAVLVILAILALIVTPLVLNIIKKARVSADKRSVDAYGRSIELSVMTYLMENGIFPTSVDQLNVEYKGNKIECETTKLNADSTVYLEGCKVDGRDIDYTYGIKEEYDYKVGDKITYNGVQYYVIKNSRKQDTSVTLLKAEPLTYDEILLYGTDHTNMYNISSSSDSYQKPYKITVEDKDYGGIAYYTSETCNYTNQEGCKNDYESSEIKYVVDSWAQDQTKANDLVEDFTGYSVRLITNDEIINNIGAEIEESFYNIKDGYPWIYNDQYYYWTMTSNDNDIASVWYVTNDKHIVNNYYVYYYKYYTVRPVITILKASISN